MDLLEHHFPPSVAIECGVNAAIFLRDIYFWCKTNENNNENFFEGRWWTYQTMNGFCNRHPYWTKNQVEYLIRTCKEKGYLLIGHFSDNPMHRTCWYALSDKGQALFQCGNFSNCISENSEMDIEKFRNEDRKIQKCNNDKYITKNIKHTDNAREIFDEMVSLLRGISAPDDASATRDAILHTLNQNGYSCQHQAPTPRRSEDSQYTGRVGIVAAKDGTVFGIAVDRKTPREKSIYKLREFQCDYRIIVLRSGQELLPPAGIDAVVSIHDADAEDLFLKFWGKYPKKAGRAAAYDAFKKLGVTDALLLEMLHALAIQSASQQWKEDNGRYIPHASTWLNGRRWEDEIPTLDELPSENLLRGKGVRYE